MIMLRMLAALIFITLLTGCIVQDIEKLRNDTRLLRDYLKASPVATHCSQPGRDQDIVCNYKLVIWNVGGEVYRGHVAPSLVEEGIKACNDLRKAKVDEYDFLKDSECVTPDTYRYNVYEFKIAGPTIPESDNPVDLVNEPHGPYMKKGHVGIDNSTHLPLAR